MKKKILSLLFLLVPIITFAQETVKKGLDERINDEFMPFAIWWEGFVLTKIPIAGNDVPLVVLLLVVGATLFTIYFGFPAVTKFRLAVNTVRGKYDEIDHHSVEKSDIILVDGDIPDTIKDEGKDGEVSHFQALATAVSGTVGLGNIAGVAVAIAVGGPGATFWMIVCGFIGMSTKFVECTLGVKYRDVGEDGTVYGGPMYYLKRGLQAQNKAILGKILAVIFFKALSPFLDFLFAYTTSNPSLYLS